MEKPIGCTVQPENIYSCILKVIGQVLENQKRISNTKESVKVDQKWSLSEIFGETDKKMLMLWTYTHWYTTLQNDLTLGLDSSSHDKYDFISTSTPTRLITIWLDRMADQYTMNLPRRWWYVHLLWVVFVS